MARVSFRDQLLRTREDAIVSAVNRLLAEKGFDAMTVDEVAAEVGIAKASLYRHFPSKEALAAAAMIRVLEQAQAHLAAQPAAAAPIDRLRDLARWTMQVQLAGEMPSLPAQNSALRAALTTHKAYLERLMELTDAMGALITAAQQAGSLSPALPPEAVLYTLFARACDPVLGLLKSGGAFTDEQIIEMLLSSCFDGLSARGKASKKRTTRDRAG